MYYYYLIIIEAIRTRRVSWLTRIERSLRADRSFSRHPIAFSHAIPDTVWADELWRLIL